jgi:predicted metal-dependent hydrolase
VAEAIRIGDPEIEVRLRRNARARRMVLRVAQAGRPPTLTLPPEVPLSRARMFLADKEPWLRRQLSVWPGAIPVRDRSVLPFGGGWLKVQAVPAGRLERAGDLLLVPGPRLPVRVAAWLREEARRACVAAVGRHAQSLGLRPGKISLRDPRSRWGSCTATGDLMFSWRLIMAPPEVLDYVAAHEVAHLVEMNHSPRFWSVVRRLFPEHEARRDWLRHNGPRLHGYDFRDG